MGSQETTCRSLHNNYRWWILTWWMVRKVQKVLDRGTEAGGRFISIPFDSMAVKLDARHDQQACCSTGARPQVFGAKPANEFVSCDRGFSRGLEYCTSPGGSNRGLGKDALA